MPIEITVPRLGWSMEEALFAGWLRSDGETVRSGEPLFAVESDKVTMEVESLDNGVLHVPRDSPKAGDVVKAGQRIGLLLAEGESPEQSIAVSPPADARPPRIPVSPRARAVARSLGVDLAGIVPREGARRVVEADVRRAFESRAVSRPAPSRPAPSRAGIAARMEESFRAPHFYVHAEADATYLARAREAMIPIVEERHGVRVTYNDFLVRAIALALRAMPAVNSFWKDGAAAPCPGVHVGLAVQAGERLMVPVIRDADRLTVGEIAAERVRLVERCLKGSANASDFADGSVTLSNLGPFGVDRFQAILNPPQSAIVAVGRIAKRPWVDGDAVVARLTVPVSISVDHRVVDGVAAAKFLSGIMGFVESPLRLIV